MPLKDEFGVAGIADAAGNRRAVYFACATDDNAETIALFYQRCNEYMHGRGIKLGEGLLSIYDEDDLNPPGFPITLQVGAPMIEGPDFLEGETAD